MKPLCFFLGSVTFVMATALIVATLMNGSIIWDDLRNRSKRGGAIGALFVLAGIVGALWFTAWLAWKEVFGA